MYSSYKAGGTRSETLKEEVPSFIVNIIWICCVLMGFDFKGQQSGGWYQIISFILTFILLSMIGILLSGYKSFYPNKRLQWILIFITLFLGSSAVVAYFQNIPLSNYQVLIAPYLLFFLTCCMVSQLCRHFGPSATLKIFLPPLKGLVVISAIWTFYYGLNISDVTLETARYRLISASLPFAVAYLASGFFSKSLTIWDKVFSVLVLSILILGQTRSYILVVMVGIVFATYGHSPNGVSWLKKIKNVSFWGAAVLVATFFVIDTGQLLIGTETNTNFLDAWNDRIFGTVRENGFDLTAATRFAEYENQMNQLFSSPINALVGMGFGATYSLSGEYGNLIAAILQDDSVDELLWSGGHSLWVYTLYANGIVFGSLFLILILYTAFKSLRLLKLASQMKSRVDRHKIVSAAVGYLCILATSFTSNPMGFRTLSFLLGVLVALVIALEYMLCKRKRLR